MKNPKVIIGCFGLMTFCVGLITPIIIDLLSNVKEIGPLGWILIACIFALFVLVPAFYYDLIRKNKITVEKITKEHDIS